MAYKFDSNSMNLYQAIVETTAREKKNVAIFFFPKLNIHYGVQ